MTAVLQAHRVLGTTQLRVSQKSSGPQRELLLGLSLEQGRCRNLVITLWCPQNLNLNIIFISGSMHGIQMLTHSHLFLTSGRLSWQWWSGSTQSLKPLNFNSIPLLYYVRGFHDAQKQDLRLAARLQGPGSKARIPGMVFVAVQSGLILFIKPLSECHRALIAETLLEVSAGSCDSRVSSG